MLIYLKCSIVHKKSSIYSAALELDRLLWEFGYCLSAIVNSEEPLDPVYIVDIECLCTLVVLCGAFAVITSAVSFPG